MINLNQNNFIVDELNLKEKSDKCLQIFSKNKFMKSRDCIHNYCRGCIKKFFDEIEINDDIKCYKCCSYNKLHQLKHKGEREPIFQEYKIVKKFLKNFKNKKIKE